MSTTTSTIAVTTVDPQALVDAYATVLDATVEVVAGIAPAQAADPTPCDEFDVAALVGHTKGAIRRGFDLASGIDAFAAPLDDSLWPDAPWADQVRAEADAALAAWEAADFDATYHVPWATYTGRQALTTYTIEVATHAWDLAVATAQPFEFDPEVGELLLALAPAIVPGGEFRGVASGMPFAEVQAAPEGSGPYTRLAAWLGRAV